MMAVCNKSPEGGNSIRFFQSMLPSIYTHLSKNIYHIYNKIIISNIKRYFRKNKPSPPNLRAEAG